ncbi:hypothetical protein C630_12905 [Klebsiella pneumoniae subsp. pneumoniae KpO3210]|nr:hypothetical protein APT86_13110 [Klebsiella pneumoniae]OVW99974.1 hypothetical protein BME32_11785 [Klebsiella pneumoniae]PIJ28322.1 hypothetical protein C630_12905 [Klebsiella pneumoniae subsp. pneumoniae KpO3210]GKI71231.1 hypothetical protein NUKP6_44260 [Klebsiella variicola]HBX6359366.1 hypothetical protein [Klebsiella pneumoniae]
MDVGRQGGKRQGDAARRSSRGLGLTRLDGTRPRATVASKVMESGETADMATTAAMCRSYASEARRPEAGSRAVSLRDVEAGECQSRQG